jgi:general secretion pathway protein E
MRYPLPYAFARTHQLLLEEEAEHQTLWMHRGSHAGALSEVCRKYPNLLLQTQDTRELAQRISSAYAQGESSAAAVVSEVESDADLSRMMQDLPAIEDLLETSDDAPIIRMLNALLTQAARDGASDIHIEPYERHSCVRFRVDGTMREVVQPNRALHAALISRLKIMAELDIAERRMPQDGRISLRIGTRAVDVRVSTLPSAYGERAVLRLLDKSEGRLSLEALGMQGEVLQQFERLVTQPHGIVLVTGPTGSGKTTTLYAALARLDASQSNIMTVEDPIEYELSGIGQTQVNPKIDLDFAKALRAILRQDPDVIMIGEIRDFETAQIAIQASLTGHLVLATLHTNDAVSAVTRLTDMGVEPFLLSSSLLGVLAQRLVRKLCPVCKVGSRATKLGLDPDFAKQNSGSDPNFPSYHPVGCEVCGRSGYKGRTGIYELLTANDQVRALIHSRAAESQLFVAAEAAGLTSMRADGERLVQLGVTSREELLRVTRD